MHAWTWIFLFYNRIHLPFMLYCYKTWPKWCSLESSLSHLKCPYDALKCFRYAAHLVLDHNFLHRLINLFHFHCLSLLRVKSQSHFKNWSHISKKKCLCRNVLERRLRNEFRSVVHLCVISLKRGLNQVHLFLLLLFNHCNGITDSRIYCLDSVSGLSY